MSIFSRRRANPASPNDEGFALATVLVTMSLLTLFVVASVSFATGTIPQSRRAQDFQAAIAAAQVGVDDVLSRLNTCDTYWREPCTGSPTPLDPDTYIQVPGADGNSPAEFRYQFIDTPADGGSSIRLRSWGRVNGVERSITVDLTKASFLEFIYYTDKESLDPATLQAAHPPRTDTYGNGQYYDAYFSNGAWRYKWIHSIQFNGITDAEAASTCGRHFYGTSPYAGERRPPRESARVTYKDGSTRDVAAGSPIYRFAGDGSDDFIGLTYTCDINFVTGDTIEGALYTMDAALLSGQPKFDGTAETRWLQTSNPAADPAAPYRKASSGSRPHDDGNELQIATRIVEMPPDNSVLRQQAQERGCLYYGPTRIRLDASGQLLVTSPMTTAANLGCGTNLTSERSIAIPDNGTIYVDAAPATQSCPAGKIFGVYPVSQDITTYDCRAGDVFVEGSLKGQLTIAANNNVIITDDVTYSRGREGADVLGLIANGFVTVYHPVRCHNQGPNGCLSYKNIGGTHGGNDEIEINAAILSTSHSFTVQNYDKGEKLETLNVFGGLYQRHRGPVGTGAATSGTGYLKHYQYDNRLVAMPPPNFIEPMAAPWVVAGFSED